MLPLLPAIILLILQGPANIERMALDGRLPAALQAIHLQMEAEQQELKGSPRADSAVLASLLALSGDAELSQALLALLSMSEVQDLASSARHDFASIQEDPGPTLPIPLKLGRPTDGFVLSQRSRDGPHRA